MMCHRPQRAWGTRAPPRRWSAPLWRVKVVEASRGGGVRSPGETALMLRLPALPGHGLWAQGRRLLGELCPLAPSALA